MSGERAGSMRRLFSPAKMTQSGRGRSQFSGRLSELGQPLIRRKADAMLQDFAKNLQGALAGS